MSISFILALFNEEGNIQELYKRLTAAAGRLNLADYEIIFIDDGSWDNSYSIVRELAGHDRRVRVIKFSRNFGQQRAIIAGLENCRSDAALITDSDLQDDPNLMDRFSLNIKRDLISFTP